MTIEPRVALITGANTGIGRVTAIRLAQHGYRLFLAGRSLERTQPVIDELVSLTGRSDVATFLPLQLDDLASVRACASIPLSLASYLPIAKTVGASPMSLVWRQSLTARHCTSMAGKVSPLARARRVWGCKPFSNASHKALLR